MRSWTHAAFRKLAIRSYTIFFGLLNSLQKFLYCELLRRAVSAVDVCERRRQQSQGTGCPVKMESWRRAGSDMHKLSAAWTKCYWLGRDFCTLGGTESVSMCKKGFRT
jgi:hypothetical protein